MDCMHGFKLDLYHADKSGLTNSTGMAPPDVYHQFQ